MEVARSSESEERQKRDEIARQAEQIERDLGLIRRVIRQPLEAEVAKGKLTVPQMAAANVIVRNRGISLKELSQAMSLAHSTVSGIVDRLEKNGMIERRPDAADGRITRIYPAAVVAEFIEKVIPELSRGPLQSALQRASAEERLAIAAAIRRLRELLEGK